MPSILIGSTRYHLCFRILVKCQLRTEDSGHYVVAEELATCLPSDVFDPIEGKRRAFSEMIKNYRSMTLNSILDDKKERKRLWGQFLFWVSGKKKKQVKQQKKNAGFGVGSLSPDDGVRLRSEMSQGGTT